MALPFKVDMNICIFLAVMLSTLLFASCDSRKDMLPRSGGLPCEVTVVGDVDSLVYRVLSVDKAGLPQSEPMFDVREAKASPSEALEGVLRYARALVIVDINPKKYVEVSLGSRCNVFAEPQVILVLCAPSVSALRDSDGGGALGGFAQKIIDKLYANDIRAAMVNMQRNHNPKMEAEVKRMFGFDILLPADMTLCKHGKNFLWISNNSPTAMQNICIYSQSFSKRDSVMRVNIKGETDSMYMTTVPGTCSAAYACRAAEALSWHDWYGLWEMKGDAMGGPLVARTIWGLTPNAPVTVEGFVYAPGQKKRNLVMQLEAVLKTVGKSVHSNQ